MRRREGCTGAMTTDDTAPVCTIVACNNHKNYIKSLIGLTSVM